MSIVQVKGSGGTTTDRTPFYGARIPEEIKRMIKPLKLCDKKAFRKILQGNKNISYTFYNFPNF